MKLNKKQIGLIAGLACLILCVLLLITRCGGNEENIAPTNPSTTAADTQSTTVSTEETQPTTEPTEAPTSEPTEETTEPTESGGSSTPGGAGGFEGGSADEPETETQPEEEEEVIVIDAPGTAGNPYAEVFDEELGSFKTVKLDNTQTVFYNLYSAAGAILTIESTDCYVIYNGITYEPQEGIVTVPLAEDAANAPIPVQFGTRGAGGILNVTLAWPQGTEGNPYEITVNQIPANASTLQIPAGETLYYNVYGANDKLLIVYDAAAAILYKDVTYMPIDGKISFLLDAGKADSPAKIGITNTAAEARQISLIFDHIYGTPERPFTLELGEITSCITGDTLQGVHYNYTASANGVLTLQYLSGAEGVSYDYLIYNQTACEYRSLTTDAVTDETTGITTLSIQLSQGDVLNLLVKTLPGEDGSYPEAELVSSASFTEDAVLSGDDSGRQKYTVTVTDAAALPIADVQLTFSVGGMTMNLTTNEEGNATISLPAASYSFTVTVPEGYTAPETLPELTAEAPACVIALAKTEEEPPTEPEETTAEYTVTVTDYNGNAQSGVVVQILKDGAVAAMQTTDASGTARATLDKADYTVVLAFSTEGYYYDENAAVLTANSTSVQIFVTSEVPDEIDPLYVGDAYILSTGGTYVDGMQSNVINYFIFTPETAGLYRFSTSNPAAVISYWGGNTSFIQNMTASTDYADNAFTMNVKEKNLGMTCIVGVTGASECIVEIIRVSDPILDESDIVPTVYEAKTPPTPFKLVLPAGQSLTYVDVTAPTSSYSAVLGPDGYYHLNSAEGPVLYVNLGENAPYVSMYSMLGYTGYGGTSLMKTFYDENGVAVSKEDYTACMCQYVESIDSTYDVYPMTEDLYYMIRQGGEQKGWWNSESPNYRFGDISGLNPELGWMFAVCYPQ